MNGYPRCSNLPTKPPWSFSSRTVGRASWLCTATVSEVRTVWLIRSEFRTISSVGSSRSLSCGCYRARCLESYRFERSLSFALLALLRFSAFCLLFLCTVARTRCTSQGGSAFFVYMVSVFFVIVPHLDSYAGCENGDFWAEMLLSSFRPCLLR